MDSPTSAPSRPDATSTGSTAAFTREGDTSLRIEGDRTADRPTGYSLIVRGEVQSSSILSTTDPRASITLLENDTKLLSGSVAGETAGFVVDGNVVAAEFDDPEPTVTVDDAVVDPDEWPTVKEYTGFGPNQDPVEDPFPDSGALGAPTGDPLHPDDYVITIDAADADEPAAYCFDIDGDVVDYDAATTVSDPGDRAYGCLSPDEETRIEVRGVITRIDTADGIEFSIEGRDAY